MSDSIYRSTIRTSTSTSCNSLTHLWFIDRWLLSFANGKNVFLAGDNNNNYRKKTDQACFACVLLIFSAISNVDTDYWIGNISLDHYSCPLEACVWCCKASIRFDTPTALKHVNCNVTPSLFLWNWVQIYYNLQHNITLIVSCECIVFSCIELIHMSWGAPTRKKSLMISVMK